jgi:hypothetical protein
MAPRDVFLRFKVVTLQAKISRLKEVIKTVLQKNPLKKVLVYTNFAMDANNKLKKACLEVLQYTQILDNSLKYIFYVRIRIETSLVIRSM